LEDSSELDLLCKPSSSKYGNAVDGSPCDKTAATSLQSLETHPSGRERPTKDGTAAGWAATNAAMKNQIAQMRLNIPRAMKSMKFAVPGRGGRGGVDLADLAVATMCVVPRHGAGIAIGRMPFERVRNSLMLHMIQENRNSSSPPPRGTSDEIGGDDVAGVAGETSSRGGKTRIVTRFDALLRGCIADEGLCFVEKSQEAVRLAKNALEVSECTCFGHMHDLPFLFFTAHLREYDTYYLRIQYYYSCSPSMLQRPQELNALGKSKSELGRRNSLCVKFLSGMYRDVVNDERDVPSRDGLYLMVVATAYYALGKFEPALCVLQRAGIELSKKISTSPEYNVYCAKLFNNMGCAYFEMGKYEKAMHSYQRALQLFHNDADGVTNYGAWVCAIIDQASIMNNMAYTLIKFRRYDDASDLVDTSFELQQILPVDADKTMLISTLSTMAFIYYRTKKYKLSLDTYTGKCIPTFAPD
jgi:tetratricopeptide (TPR) repeat protein